MEDGKQQGRRLDLVGGGLIRSLGGWSQVLSLRDSKKDLKHDARRRHPGDVAENRDFISLSHEMEIPMAEIARNVGYVDQLSLRQFKRWNQRIRFIDFINVPIFPCVGQKLIALLTCQAVGKGFVEKGVTI